MTVTNSADGHALFLGISPDSTIGSMAGGNT